MVSFAHSLLYSNLELVLISPFSVLRSTGLHCARSTVLHQQRTSVSNGDLIKYIKDVCSDIYSPLHTVDPDLLLNLLIFLFLLIAFLLLHVCSLSSEERSNCNDRTRPCYAMSNITLSPALLEGILNAGALYT